MTTATVAELASGVKRVLTGAAAVATATGATRTEVLLAMILLRLSRPVVQPGEAE